MKYPVRFTSGPVAGIELAEGELFAALARALKLPRGYYHEYTVRTPGAPTRGARRVVRGDGGELYYTRDHYRTFIRL